MGTVRTEATGARARLRAATRDAHARVDGSFPRGLEDIACYRRYLRGMHALVAALGHAFERAGTDAGWRGWWMPQRAHWLAADLDALSLPPSPTVSLGIAGHEGMAGALYVLEGSAMGAAGLLRDVRALGFTPARGAAFLDGHGGRTAGPRWRAFVDYLDDAGFDEPGLARMCDAAVLVFDHVHHAFQCPFPCKEPE